MTKNTSNLTKVSHRHYLELMVDSARFSHTRGFIASQLENPVELLQPLFDTYSSTLVVSPTGFSPFICPSDSEGLSASHANLHIKGVCESITPKKLRHYLGRELELLVLDFREGIDANVLGIGCGLICGGGMLVLLLPIHFPSTPFEKVISSQIDVAEGCLRVSNSHVSYRCFDGEKANPPYVDKLQCRSLDQALAVEAIKRVSTGHSKRPLVLTADRGRGKSSALGLGIAQLMSDRPLNVIVTAPQFSAVSGLFSLAASQLGLDDSKHLTFDFPTSKQASPSCSQLRFIAPDSLLSERPDADLVIVDEAAAIPVPMLFALAKHYRRMVFSTTTHGYEGSGQGFQIKFVPLLKTLYPNFRQLTLTTPIRWAQHCPLEQWLFDALLLDAEPSRSNLSSSSSPIYRVIDQVELIENPTLLRHLFGLLIEAHYQTSPSDLMQMLDDSAISIFVAEEDNQIIGCLLACSEGGFEPSLAEDVRLGRRRVKGNMMAQSIAMHTGTVSALEGTATRIMRVAVSSQYRRAGIGTGLVNYLRQTVETDYLGTSFACHTDTLMFWTGCGFVPVRLGISRDASSGTHSMLMVHHHEAPAWLEPLFQRFGRAFVRQCLEQFQTLDINVVMHLLTVIPQFDKVSSSDIEVLILYANGGLGYDLVVDELSRWVRHFVSSSNQVPSFELEQLVLKCVMNQSWALLLNSNPQSSRKQIEHIWRQYLGQKLAEFTV